MNETNVYGDVFRVGDIVTFITKFTYEILEIYGGYDNEKWTIRCIENDQLYDVFALQIRSAKLVRAEPPRPPKYSREEIVRMFVR